MLSSFCGAYVYFFDEGNPILSHGKVEKSRKNFLQG